MSVSVLETTDTLSEKINVPKNTLCQWVREKRIPAYKFGKKYFYDLEEVISAIKKNKD